MNKTPLAHSAPRHVALAILTAAMLAAGSLSLSAAETPSVVDDFSHAGTTSLGHPRIVIDDAAVGGKSHLAQQIEDGILRVEGEIVPGRGSPGWMGLVLMLSPDGTGVDLSAYEGIKLRVRVQRGHLSVSANSTEIDNFDYHGALVATKGGDDFQEVRIAFKDMKRGWSAQTPLNPATISSLSLTAVDMQKGAFAYEIDEVGFY